MKIGKLAQLKADRKSAIRLDLPSMSNILSSGSSLVILGTPGNAQVGSAYDFTPVVIGGEAPYNWTRAGTLFMGFSFLSGSGKVSATSAGESGTMSLIMTVTDKNGLQASKLFEIVVTPLAPDTTPDAFTVPGLTNQVAGAAVTAKPTSPLSGFNAQIPFNFNNGLSVSTNNGSSFSTSGNIPTNIGNNLVFRYIAPDAGTSVNVNISIGGTQATWSIASQAAPSDNIPDAFSLAALYNQVGGSLVTSKPSSPLTGFDLQIPFSFTGGLTASIDNGATFAASGNIPTNIGNNLVFRYTAPTAGTTVNVSVNLNGTSTTWSITSESTSASMPSGAEAIWLAKNTDLTGTRGVVPNEVTKAGTPLTRPVNDPTITAANWSTSGITQTTGVADEKGRPRGVQCDCTGSWSMRCDLLVDFNAGNHIVAVYAKAAAPVAVRAGTGYDVSSRPSQTIGTGWTRLTQVDMKSAGDSNPINIIPVTPGSATITIGTCYVYEGSSDPFPSGESGAHLWLGGNAKSRKPSFAANELDLSATNTSRVLALFDTAATVGGSSGSMTLVISTRRTAAFTDEQALVELFSTNANDYGDPVGACNAFSRTPTLQMAGFDFKAFMSPGSGDKLFNPLNKGYNVWAFTYDGATGRTLIFLNDVLMAADTGPSSAATITGLVAPFREGAAGKVNAIAFYKRAFTKADVAQASAYLNANATADGLSLDTQSNFIWWEGDSNPKGNADSAPGGRSFPYLYRGGASGATDHYGFMFAKSGAKQSDVIARAPLLKLSPMLTAKGGRKPILVGMFGTNDGTDGLTSSASEYASARLAYWADMKAAGFITVDLGFPSRTDPNAATGFTTWRNQVLDAIAAAVGNQLDAFVDPRDNPNIGSDTAPNNTVYFSDGVHYTFGPGGGHAAVYALLKPKLDILFTGGTVADATPDAFTVSSVTGADPLTTQVRSFQLAGYDTAPEVKGAGQQFSLDNIEWFGSVFPAPPATGQTRTIYVRANAPVDHSTTGNFTVNAGGTTANWSITTKASTSQTPASILGNKHTASFDVTDAASMFTDVGGTVPINPTGTLTERTVACWKAKGDPTKMLVQSVLSKRPVYGATSYNAQSPGLSFDGVDDFMVSSFSYTTLTTGIGAALAMQLTPGGPGRILEHSAALDDGVTLRLFFAGNDDGSEWNGGAYAYYDGVQAFGGPYPNVSAAQRIYSEHNGSSLKIYWGKPTGGPVQTGTGNSTLNANAGEFYLGARRDGAGPFKGVIQQVILYNAAATSTERANLDSWMKEREGASVFNVELYSSNTTCSMAAGSNILVIPAVSPDFTVGRQLVIEPHTGVGTKNALNQYWPGQARATDAAVAAETTSVESAYMASTATGKVFSPKQNVASFVGSRNGTTLTVTTSESVLILIGSNVQDVYGGIIEEQLSSTTGSNGGAGTYRTSNSATAASSALKASKWVGYSEWSPNAPYHNQIRPVAIVATIIGGAGTTNIELSITAVTAIPAGTFVAVDNEPIIHGIAGPDGSTFNFIAASGSAVNGPFYISGTAGFFQGKRNWTLQAALSNNLPVFTLQAPKFAQGAFFHFNQCVSPTVRGFMMIGNLDDGKGTGKLGLGPGPNANFGKGILFEACSDGVQENCKTIDVADLAFGSRFPSTGSRGLKSEDNAFTLAILTNKCHAETTCSQATYIQWQFNRVGGDAIAEFRDCSFYGTKIMPAIECFEAGNNRIIRFTSTNGLLSQNTCNTFYIKDPVFTFLAMSRDTTVADPPSFRNPIFNINNNSGNLSTGNVGSGGVIENPTIIQEGHIDAAGNVMSSIISVANDLQIIGTYDDAVADDGNRKGLIRAPWRGAGAAEVGNGAYIGLLGPGTSVVGIRTQSFSYAGSTEPTGYYRPDIDMNDMQDKSGASIRKTITGVGTPRITTGVGTSNHNTSNIAYMAL